MDRFLQIIAVGLLGVLLAGCADEYVCPAGTVSDRSRCRFVGPDAVDADVFAWPRVEPATDLGAPVPIRPDAAAGVDGASDDAAPSADGESVDGESVDGESADGESVDGESVDGESVGGDTVDGDAPADATTTDAAGDAGSDTPGP